MKIKFTATDNKIGYYVWSLARNLLHAKRNLKKLSNKSGGDDGPSLEFLKGVCNEAHNRFYSAKEYFNKEING